MCGQVCAGVLEYAQVCAGLRGCVLMWMGVRECAQLCMGVHGVALGGCIGFVMLFGWLRELGSGLARACHRLGTR